MPLHPLKILSFLLLILLFIFPLTAIQADGGGSVTLGNAVQGDLLANEQDTWTFRGLKGQRIVLSAERYPADPTAFFNPYLELYSPTGELLASDDDRGVDVDALILGYTLPVDGLYAVKVDSRTANWAEGSYQLVTATDTLPVDCASWEGETLKGTWHSDIAKYDLPYRIYLPPCYQEQNLRYPYILLMHGSASDDSHWDRLGMDDAVMRGIALGRIPPIAVVMPFGMDYANINIFTENGSYEYMILNELMPIIEEGYCVQNSREGRAIGGISRGGFWAYIIGLRHLELFAAVGGHSPFFDLWNAPATHNPLDLASSITWGDENMPRLYIDRGKNDYAQENIDLFAERLDNHGIPFIFEYFEVGEHRDNYWSAHLDDYLAFYTQEWDASTYPVCHEEKP